jgi:hypothetical protein
MALFDKYSGPWSKHLAAHLLRRTTFGANWENINTFGNLTLSQCIERLFEVLPKPAPPININYDLDPDVPIGETWVDKGATGNVNGYRTTSLRTWSFEQMISSQPNIREKMTLFWHNHFVTADINDPRYSYKYIALLRSQALGNFKQLTKDITIDPAMLNYLNGRDNTRQAPNENYARELMELFTLGKGDQVGPGDYTTFTEEDVKEVAKCLTGWIDVRNNLPIRTEFRVARHDTTIKTLSHRFGNVVINNAGDQEYKNLIDIIFTKEEVSLFIARKLYRWFVYFTIDENIESQIIEPMAALIRENDYNLVPAIKALLSSEYFYDECVIGGMIKNPVDFLINPVNQFNIVFPPDAASEAKDLNSSISIYLLLCKWLFFKHHPWQVGKHTIRRLLIIRLWLNATSLPARQSYNDAIVTTGFPQGQARIQIDPFLTLDKFANPADVDEVIRSFGTIVHAKPVADNQFATLKSEFLLGLNEQTWTDVYNAYKADPSNVGKRQAVLIRVRSLLVYMMRMPEYHLS